MQNLIHYIPYSLGYFCFHLFQINQSNQKAKLRFQAITSNDLCMLLCRQEVHITCLLLCPLLKAEFTKALSENRLQNFSIDSSRFVQLSVRRNTRHSETEMKTIEKLTDLSLDYDSSHLLLFSFQFIHSTNI